MSGLEELVVRAPDWYRTLEQAIFGDGSASTVTQGIESFVSAHMGTVEDALFYKAGVGLVVGLRLARGAQVVLKIHRHNASMDRLGAVQRVQQHLASEGLPAPAPLLPPMMLGQGIATVEEYRPGGSADGHSPAVRTALAVGLCQLVRSASSVTVADDVGGVSAVRSRGEALWDEPHDLRFDFEATSAGAEWIDDLARVARSRLALTLPHVVGHVDWRVENLGFDGAEIVAIYDWDSLAAAPEAVVVGQAAGGFSTDWRVGPETLPSVKEMAAFVADYESERGEPFSSVERDAMDAANLYLCAYGARCEHSDRVLWGLEDSPASGWLRLLQERGEQGLLSRL